MCDGDSLAQKALCVIHQGTLGEQGGVFAEKSQSALSSWIQLYERKMKRQR